MYKLEIKLKQHTPLIHFQHDQDGATLRASEVKPKLDKFILSRLTQEEKAQGEREGWVKSKNDKEWLDYQMRIDTGNIQVMKMELDTGKINDKTGKPIISKMPLFFGNMSNDGDMSNWKEMRFTNLPVYVAINSKYEELIKIINTFRDEFFLLNNFGSRQSKGFGSFFPIEKEISKREFPFYSFCIPSHNVGSRDDFINLFQYVELFYKTIRSGINQSGYYFKSMMYHYAKYKSEYWDKRAIRTHFELFANYDKEKRKSFELFRPNLTTKKQLDRGEVKDSTIDGNKGCEVNNGFNIKLYRDVLGLSSIQEWGFYGATISKNNPDIERHKSPLLLKPIYDEGARQYYVFVIPQMIPSAFLNKQIDVCVEYKIKNNPNQEKLEKRQRRNSSKMILSTPSDFNVAEFIKYVFEGPGNIILKEQINKMPDAVDKFGKKKNGIKEKLKRIYNIH